jgi:hypothetical protein
MPHERVLYPEIIAGLKAEGHRAWRVPDGGGPVDIAGFTSSGHALLVEVKKLDTWRNGEWPLDPWGAWGFEPHQVGWLSECAGAGGVGCAVLWVPSARAVRAVCLSRGPGRCGWPYVKDRVRRLDRVGGEVRGWSALPGWPFR